MNVNQTSTEMSTNKSSEVIRLEQELASAQEAGARKETIQTLKQRIQESIDKEETDRKNNDIRYLKEWPNEILIKHYDEATKQATKLFESVSTITLFDKDAREQEVKDYETALKLVELLEDEGRDRKIVPFLTEAEIKAIFDSKGKE